MLRETCLENIFKVLVLFLDESLEYPSIAKAHKNAIRQAAGELGTSYQAIGDLCSLWLDLESIDEFRHLLRWYREEL